MNNLNTSNLLELLADNDLRMEIINRANFSYLLSFNVEGDRMGSYSVTHMGKVFHSTCTSHLADMAIRHQHFEETYVCDLDAYWGEANVTDRARALHKEIAMIETVSIPDKEANAIGLPESEVINAVKNLKEYVRKCQNELHHMVSDNHELF